MCKRILLLLAVTSLAAQAAESVPTEASIRELLTVTHVQKMLDEITPSNGCHDAEGDGGGVEGPAGLPAEQKLIDQSRANAIAMMKEELAWSKLEPL